MQSQNYSTGQSRNGSAYHKALKQQLEKEAALLLRQRSELQTFQSAPMQSQTVPSQYSIIEQSQMASQFSRTVKPHQIDHSQSRSVHLSTVRSKIQEVISLCNTNKNFKELAEAQQNLLRKLTNMQQQRPPTFQTRKQVKLKSPKKSFHATEKKSISKHAKSTIREQVSQKGIQINDEIMELIEDIQAKSFQQIQKLRNDKLHLLKKLNEEIKLHNIEKNKCSQLYKHINLLAQELKKRGMNVNSMRQVQNIIQQNLDESLQEEDQQTPQLESPNDDPSNIYSPIHRRNSQHNKNHSRNPSSNIQRLQNSTRPQNFKSEQHHSRPFEGRGYQNNASPSFPRIKTVQSELEIQNQMQRLKNENSQMKNFISQARGNRTQNIISPNKQQLRNQLNQLRQKAHHYQNLINQARNNRGITFNNHQYQDLLIQSNNIAAQGNRLMKVKSNPNFRSGGQLEHIAEQERNSSSLIRPPQAFDINQRSFTGNMDSQRIGARFQEGQYQDLMESMRKATYQ